LWGYSNIVSRYFDFYPIIKTYMFKFFFNSPGVFYGFGYDENSFRNTKNERLTELQLESFFLDRTFTEEAPTYINQSLRLLGQKFFLSIIYL
jgi:hypothetical protein